ncbi:hypothetical protein ACXD4E_000459 [Campylobacter upsaliensis]
MAKNKLGRSGGRVKVGLKSCETATQSRVASRRQKARYKSV